MQNEALGLPSYICHKTVGAAKIVSINSRAGKLQVYLENTDPSFVTVTRKFATMNKPQIGGYLVQYADGYLSYSPALAFEEGYNSVVEEMAEVEVVVGEVITQAIESAFLAGTGAISVDTDTGTAEEVNLQDHGRDDELDTSGDSVPVE